MVGEHDPPPLFCHGGEFSPKEGGVLLRRLVGTSCEYVLPLELAPPPLSQCNTPPPVFLFTEGPSGWAREFVKFRKISVYLHFCHKSIPSHTIYLCHISLHLPTKLVRDLGLAGLGHFMSGLGGNNYKSVHRRLLSELGGHVMWCGQGMIWGICGGHGGRICPPPYITSYDIFRGLRVGRRHVLSLVSSPF